MGNRAFLEMTGNWMVLLTLIGLKGSLGHPFLSPCSSSSLFLWFLASLFISQYSCFWTSYDILVYES